MQVTDEMVNRGARAMCEMNLHYTFTDKEWQSLVKHGGMFELIRRAFPLARRCLEAALGGDGRECE